MNDWDRREVLAGVAGLLALDLRTAPPPAADVGVAFKGTVEEKVAKAILLATGKDPTAFFKTVVSPKDTVGLKLNCLAGRPVAPRVELVEALVRSLVRAGVPEEQVIVWERADRELQRAGFDIRTEGGGYRCFGTNGQYDKEVSESRSVGTCFSSLLSKKITKLINVGVLKDHDLSGISVGLKNYYGVIHNPNKYHGNNCSPFVAHLADHPNIRGKHILTVVDAEVCQYHGGPAYRADAVVPYGAVAASADLAACDFWGLREIERVRKEKGKPSLEAEKRAPLWLKVAGEIGLTKIRPETLKVATDALLQDV
jgi:uncharacterized protein (DUF362 family)